MVSIHALNSGGFLKSVDWSIMAATSPALNAKGALQSNAFEEVEEEVDKSFIIQREIELLKKAGEKFGIRLANVSRVCRKKSSCSLSL